MLKQELAKRIRESSRLTGEFTLRSGKVSSVYFDKYRFESDPELLWEIAEQMATLIPKDTEVLAGLEMGGIPIVTALSRITGLPAAFIRKEAKTYGTCNYAEGASLEGKNVVIVEDVVTSGGAILDAVSKMREDGVDPKVVLCVIDREASGQENLRSNDLQLTPLFVFSEVDGAV